MSKDFKIKKETKNINNKEDVTKYGEFVSSYFAWITLEEQKNKVKKMEEMTNKDTDCLLYTSDAADEL